MKKEDEIRLTLPADPAYVPVAVRGAEIFSLKRGLERQTAGQVSLAVEEAILNALEMGYGGTEDEISIGMAATGMGIEIRVHSLGIPLNPEQLPQYIPAKAGTRFDTGGLSFFLVKQLMDEVSFSTNIGGERRLTLVKRLPLAEVVPDRDREQARDGRKAGKAPDTAYRIRRARPGDAEDISRLMLRAHGKMLFSEDIYYPAQVEEMLRSGKMVSFVAVTGDDEIFGHGALVPMDSEGRIREMTYGAVDPGFRSLGAMSDFARALMGHAREQNVSAVMVMSITNHVHSQKAAARYGLKPCALLVATSAASSRAEKEETPNAERIANLVQVRYLDSQAAPAGLYLPPDHASMIQKIYQHLGKAIDPRSAPDPLPKPAVGTAEVRSDSDLVEGWMVVLVSAFGRDVQARVTRLLHEALLQQIPAIQLFLPLDDPLTALLTPEFEAAGFFFAGVAPEAGPREYLILQYIGVPDPGYGDIQVMDGMGEEIKAYVMQCQKRTNRLKSRRDST